MTVKTYSKSELKYRITEKFGSIEKFCALAGLRYGRTLMILNDTYKHENEGDMERITNLFTDTVPKKWEEENITEAERKKVRIDILVEYGTISKFCEQHTEFDNSFISRIINGKKMTKDERFNNLINILNGAAAKTEG